MIFNFHRNDALFYARRFRVAAFLFSIFFISTNSFAQTPPTPPNPNRTTEKITANQNDVPIEKSIAVDPKVNVKLCVAKGRLKINGWERDEIRVFVAGGRGAVGFKVLQKSRQNDSPVWVAVANADSPKSQSASVDECLSGDRIEIDVPRGAVVNVKSRASETAIDSVAKATIQNLGGGIYLRNIERAIDATTYEGDITVEKSGGAMSLSTTTGNIVALNVNPNEVGDAFKAKTNSGAIVLRGIEHRQIEAVSHSGAINFAGEMFSGGQYVFNAFNGAINLQIPPDSSCRLNASYGFGSFNSEIPMRNVIKSIAPAKAQNLSAQIGATANDAATVNLSTYSGTIQIKKQ